MSTIDSRFSWPRGFGFGLAAASLLALSPDLAIAAVDATEPAASSAAVPVARAIYARDDQVERLTLDLTAPVGHVAKLDGDQLIVWFDQPRRFDLDALSDQLGSRLIGVRTPQEGASRWLVLDLAPNSGVQSEAFDGHWLVITVGRKAARSDDITPGSLLSSKASDSTAGPSALENSERTPRAVGLVAADRASDKAADSAETASLEKTGDRTDREQVASSSKKPVPSPAKPRQLIPVAKPAVAGATALKSPIASAAAASPPKPASAAHVPPKPSASQPGQFEVDEMALDRALERTLTREGAVLLPFGSIEIEPSLRYVRREFGAPTLINLFGFPAFGETKIRRNDYIAEIAARFGLPFDAQLELDLPFSYVDQSVMTTIGFDPINEVEDDTGAFGDLGVGLAKTILKEGGWRPDVVARVRWDSHTGKAVDNNIALGGGSHELTGSLSFVKSQDPLAFFGRVAYEKTFEENDLDPGDRIGLAIGTVLAASPETSLRASLQQDFIDDAEFDGDQLDGTDQMVATLNVGASSVLGRGVLLDASAEVGLTDDAPDYSARISLPIRFDLRRTFSLSRRSTDDGEQKAAAEPRASSANSD